MGIEYRAEMGVFLSDLRLSTLEMLVFFV